MSNSITQLVLGTAVVPVSHAPSRWIIFSTADHWIPLSPTYRAALSSAVMQPAEFGLCTCFISSICARAHFSATGGALCLWSALKFLE